MPYAYKRTRSAKYGKKRVMRSISAPIVRVDSQATTDGYSQSLAVERSVNKRLKIGRNPRTTFYIARTVPFQLGWDQVNGFTSVNGASVYGNGMAMSIRLSSINMNFSAPASLNYSVHNASEFTNLFDEWRIGAVEIKTFFSNNVANNFDGTGGPVPPASSLPILQCAVDYDDSAPPTTENILIQYPNLRTVQMDTNGPKTFRFKPKAVAATEAGGIIATGYGQYSGWIDCDSSGTDWFGHKMWVQSVGTTSNQCGVFQMFVTVFYEFRGVR